MIVGDRDTFEDIAPVGSIALARAEVQDFDDPVGSQLDVRGLEIAMNNPLLVSRFDRLGDLPRDRERLVERDRSLRDTIRERRALDQFHHQRDGPV